MLHVLKIIRSKRGNVTTMWIAGLPIFMILLMFLSSLVIAWMDHANSLKAADAGSLAATKKLDQLVQDEVNRRMQAVIDENMRIPDLPFRDPYEVVLGTRGKKRELIKHVINNHKEEIAETVREYVRKNGAEPDGTITFFVDGRIQVTAETKFKSLIFKEEFKNTTVKGSGVGPKRDYMKWLSPKKHDIKY